MTSRATNRHGPRTGLRPVAAALLALAALFLLAPGPAAAAASPAKGERNSAAQQRSAAKHHRHRHRRHHHHRRRHHRKARPRPMLWGAWLGKQLTGAEAPWDMAPVSTFESMLGKGLSLVEFSSPFADCSPQPCSFFGFPTSLMEKIRAYGAIPFFSWSSASLGFDTDSVSDPDFQLSDLIAGTYDGYIRSFAEAAAAWGHPFFLRFNWEMNGNWFPWSEGVNGNSRGEFVAAWRHVHDIFTAAGATNATWVWCPYVDIYGRFLNLRSIYPGSRYVDWTCLDGFNWTANPANPQRWRSFDAIFKRTYRLMIKKVAPRKPMLLGEMASAGGPAAKARWIRRMFTLLRRRYTRIRGLIWFDKIDRGVTWPLESSDQVLRAFARGIRPPRFRANVFANLPDGPVRPPR